MRITRRGQVRIGGGGGVLTADGGSVVEPDARLERGKFWEVGFFKVSLTYEIQHKYSTVQLRLEKCTPPSAAQVGAAAHSSRVRLC